MNEFRRLAAKIDQHMQQLSALGVNDAPAIINRMMGYVPDPHKIWVGTSDDQLIALSNEFPGFYRYALIMEEAFEAEGFTFAINALMIAFSCVYRPLLVGKFVE